MTAATIRVRRDGAGAEVDALAQEAGLHPEVVRRLVALGLFDTGSFPRDAGQQLARAVRLRRDRSIAPMVTAPAARSCSCFFVMPRMPSNRRAPAEG